MKTTDNAALDAWYVIGRPEDVAPHRTYRTRLLGQDLAVLTTAADRLTVHAAEGAGYGPALPVAVKHGHIWTTLGAPDRGILDIAESVEPDRKLATCGAVRVRVSGLRLVENFLDMAHFPFVHTDILGTEEHAEVAKYDVEIRRDVDEVWATNCRFYQPQAAAHADSGQVSNYMYRVASPFNVVLYKTCPAAPERYDVIGLFVQPVEPDVSLGYAFVLVVDDESTKTALIQFQQKIFLQDRMILENQRPKLLPLDPRSEMPTRADMSSVAYRRWLKEKRLAYGVFERSAA